jgi:hypothetical protein
MAYGTAAIELTEWLIAQIPVKKQYRNFNYKQNGDFPILNLENRRFLFLTLFT